MPARSSDQVRKALFCLPILDPTYIQRGLWKQEPAQIQFLRRAKAISAGLEPEVLTGAIENYAPGTLGCAPDTLHIEDLIRFFDKYRSEGFSVDVESAGHHLVFLGFCSIETEVGIGIRFLGLKGEQVWTWQELTHIIELLIDVLGDPSVPLIHQNGPNFDIPFLERIGFPVEGVIDDTLLMAHTAYSELPKNLEFLATFYCGFPMWKHLVSTDDLGEGK